jgi:hypothetical protein
VEAVGLKTASSCCGQECRVEGKTTLFYRCSWCGKPCDDLIGTMEDSERKENHEEGKDRKDQQVPLPPAA